MADKGGKRPAKKRSVLDLLRTAKAPKAAKQDITRSNNHASNDTTPTRATKEELDPLTGDQGKSSLTSPLASHNHHDQPSETPAATSSTTAITPAHNSVTAASSNASAALATPAAMNTPLAASSAATAPPLAPKSETMAADTPCPHSTDNSTPAAPAPAAPAPRPWDAYGKPSPMHALRCHPLPHVLGRGAPMPEHFLRPHSRRATPSRRRKAHCHLPVPFPDTFPKHLNLPFTPGACHRRRTDLAGKPSWVWLPLDKPHPGTCQVSGNIARVFAQYRSEGRCTLRLGSPAIDVAITKVQRILGCRGATCAEVYVFRLTQPS